MGRIKAGSVIAALIALALVFGLAGCINVAPKPDPSVTPAPTAEPTPTPEPEETPMETAETTEAPEPGRTLAPGEALDAMGNIISGPDHYKRYLVFENIVVYEEEGDTFVDAIIVNRYSEPINCAVDIVYTEEDGTEIARARLQTRDGSYLLSLAPGDNVVLARILTDMTLTGLPYTIEFDKETEVKPLSESE